MTLFLAYRNFSRRIGGHVLLGSAVAIAFALITLVKALSFGTLEAVRDKAARYFSGHLSITGYLPGLKQEIGDPAALEAYLAAAPLPLRTIARRSAYYRGDAELFFGGSSLRQRKLIGVDFAAEGREFATLDFASGGWESLAGEGAPGILLSAATADVLQCRLGDTVSVYVTADSGRYNTAEPVVAGIFNEASLFGFVSYMRLRDVNVLLERPAGGATDLAVYLESGADPDRTAAKTRDYLARRYPTAPLHGSLAERDAALAALVDRPTLVLLTQKAQLAQIQDFLDAVGAVTYLVLVVFLFIVMAGILNTYRVMVFRRRKEIGVLRAMGMDRHTVRNLFMVEAGILGVAASLAGFAVAGPLLAALGALDFSFLPGSGIFLVGGRLHGVVSPQDALVNTALMIGTCVLAAWGPARQAGSIQPIEALRTA